MTGGTGGTRHDGGAGEVIRGDKWVMGPPSSCIRDKLLILYNNYTPYNDVKDVLSELYSNYIFYHETTCLWKY